MQLKTQGLKPRGDGSPQLAGLVLAVAVSDNVIRVALKRAAREFPVHPRVERVVHEQVSQQRRDHAPNAIDNFCFDVTLSYRRLERPRRVTGDE